MNTQPEARIEPRPDTAPLVKPQRWARLYGGLYVINIVGSSFAFGYLDALVVPGDAAATAHNILANALLYRVSLVAHLIAVLTNIPGALLFYELFKVVNRRLALLDVFFGLVATAVEAASVLSQFTPLVVLTGRNYQNALPAPQLHALAYLPGDLSTISYGIYGVFYGFDFICVAYLVFNSTFLPKAIGVLLAIDALNYLANGFATMLATGFAAGLVPWNGLPTII